MNHSNTEQTTAQALLNHLLVTEEDCMAFILSVMGVDVEQAAELTINDIAIGMDSGRILTSDGNDSLIDVPSDWEGLHYRSGNTYGFNYHCSMSNEKAFMTVSARSPIEAVQKLSSRLATNNQYWLTRCA